MLNRLVPPLTLGHSPQLPQRRWRILPPYTFLRATIGAIIGALPPFVAWWNELIPLWLVVFPMLLGALLFLPRPMILGVDERGVALIVPGWTQDKYLWIPKERLVQLEIRQGWLIANGTDVLQQGNLTWIEAATHTGATIPPLLKLSAQTGLTAHQIAAPIYLLDQIARDEIELWMFRQGK
ncbi:MAG: hypothetical protein ACRDIB_03315 [Ardenticatenaceae bacterium]